MEVHKGKRPFLVSLSTFPGSGFHAGHNLGNNSATAGDLYFSIPGILNFQMFGIPFVGANICGFEGIPYNYDINYQGISLVLSAIQPMGPWDGMDWHF